MPTMTRFGTENSQGEQGSDGVTWVDIDISDTRERDWLEAWKEIGDQARSLLLEPVRFAHRENLIDGMFLSLRTMMAGETDDFDHLADLKLLIGKSRAITVRDGELAAVDALRLFSPLGQKPGNAGGSARIHGLRHDPTYGSDYLRSGHGYG
jgi:Mg2+ and Co2+ transporter CorA